MQGKTPTGARVPSGPCYLFFILPCLFAGVGPVTKRGFNTPKVRSEWIRGSFRSLLAEQRPDPGVFTLGAHLTASASAWFCSFLQSWVVWAVGAQACPRYTAMAYEVEHQGRARNSCPGFSHERAYLGYCASVPAVQQGYTPLRYRSTPRWTRPRQG